MSITGRPAVFLDRDGTLIEDVGVITSAEQVKLFPDTIEALRSLGGRYLLFVVTNQNGIAHGRVTRSQVDAVNVSIGGLLESEGIDIIEWYVCPHDCLDGCDCIKPNPTFLIEAADRYGVDLSRSFVIGDHPHDILTGKSEGTYGLYLLTGHGPDHVEEVPLSVPVFHTLADAAGWIVNHPGAESDLRRSIREGADAIRNGGIVGFPTETVYGLGANAFDERAVSRVFEAKQRPYNDPLIVHVSDRGQLESVASSVSDIAGRLMDAFWPGPLTLVLPRSRAVPDIVTTGNPTVAVRMPSNPWALELIRLSKTPIAAPSANAFGRTSPTTARHVEEQLRGKYDVLIDGGACRVGVESTVLAAASGLPVVLRPGGTSRESIEEVIGAVRIAGDGTDIGKEIESPGMLPSHYAPRVPMSVVEDPSIYSEEPDAGIILLGPSQTRFSGKVSVLSRSGDLAEAATNLYQAIRRLDAAGTSKIIVQRFPDRGIGVAMNDRVSRASSGKRK